MSCSVYEWGCHGAGGYQLFAFLGVFWNPLLTGSSNYFSDRELVVEWWEKMYCL